MNNFNTETEFQTWANDTLRKLGIKFYHIPSKNKYVEKGIPDLLCWYKGKYFVIELKIKGGKVSKEQKEQIEDFKRNGIFTAVCYNKAEFLKAINDALKLFV